MTAQWEWGVSDYHEKTRSLMKALNDIEAEGWLVQQIITAGDYHAVVAKRPIVPHVKE